MKIWLLLLMLLPICIQAAILNVALDGSQPYLAIQTAVNAAAQNDTILVYPGTYFANIEVNQKSLTLTSLEMITGDSTYISQTIINGNQTGSCIRVIECDSVTIRGMYLTNGSGTIGIPGQTTRGGGVYCLYSNISVTNCKIMYNRNVYGGAGCNFESSVAYLSGTTIAYNHSLAYGALDYYGFPDEHETKLLFDPVNRCSIYMNAGTWGNDIKFGDVADTIHIYLDKFTVIPSDYDIYEYIYSPPNWLYSPYTLSYNTPVIVSEYSDLYVNPNGDDNNSGLSLNEPLKTISLALIKIKADSLHQQTIHLANGIYSNSLNGQLYPLNLKSYVTIQGESADGTILDGDNIYGAFMGNNSEQETRIRNITLQNFAMPPVLDYSVIKCISGYRNPDGTLKLFSLELENITIRDCHPIYPDERFRLVYFVYPNYLSLRNILIEDCSGFKALSLEGSNIIGENIHIRNFHYAPGGVNTGTAMAVTQNNYFYGNRPNVFTNLEITNCHNNNTEWSMSPALLISSCIAYTSENTFINATIADNICSPNIGGAVTLSSYTNANFINSIISNNFPYNIKFHNSGISEPCSIRLMNNLLYPCPTGNGSIHNSSPANVIEYYGTNLDTLPDFNTDYLLYPYSLNQTSPCIDAGTTDFSMFALPPDFAFPLVDLAGNPRIYGTQVDMGAYEWNGVANQDELNETPSNKIILTNYPNPFNPITNISYSLPKDMQVKLIIYNLKGQTVKTLLNDKQSSGQHSIIWNGRDDKGKSVSSGVYFYRLTTNGKSLTNKMLMLK